MTVSAYVRVPEQLAESLSDDGFRTAGIVRGAEVYVDVAAAVVGTGANLVTVLVARHEISRFIAHLWAVSHHRAPGDKHNMTVVVERGSRRVAITLEHAGFDGNGPPEDVVRGMTALLEALADPSGLTSRQEE